jgi:branched-subunit amino acid aminotransferase/4-amino-4-deoxychorismate lyase
MTALIETVRIRNGVAPLWPLHRARLKHACAVLGIRFPRSLAPPAGGADRAWRIEVGTGRPLIGERGLGALTPVVLQTSATHHPHYPHKTTDRGAFELAAKQVRRAGADDALLLTSDGWVAEGTIWSLLWFEGDQLCAPPLGLGILPGVARARLAELAGGITERRVPRPALTGLPLLVANAVRGVVEVASLDGATVPKDPSTADLRARFWP